MKIDLCLLHLISSKSEKGGKNVCRISDLPTDGTKRPISAPQPRPIREFTAWAARTEHVWALSWLPCMQNRSDADRDCLRRVPFQLRRQAKRGKRDGWWAISRRKENSNPDLLPQRPSHGSQEAKGSFRYHKHSERAEGGQGWFLLEPNVLISKAGEKKRTFLLSPPGFQ